VAQQHVLHLRVVHPVDAGLRVHLGVKSVVKKRSLFSRREAMRMKTRKAVPVGRRSLRSRTPAHCPEGTAGNLADHQIERRCDPPVDRHLRVAAIELEDLLEGSHEEAPGR